jgi:hypothetical protein
MGTHDKQSASTPDTESTDDDSLPVSRRTALAAVVGLGGLGASSESAAARSTKTWKKDRDADGQELSDLGLLTMQSTGTEIASFEGSGLTVDGNGVLNATDTDTRTDISDDGTLVVPDATDLSFGSTLDVTDDDDGSATVETATGEGASVALSTDFSVPGDILTTVPFDTELYDDNDEFDQSTHGFTPAVGGTYQVESTLFWNLGSDVDILIHELFVDDTTRATVFNPVESTIAASTTVSKVLRLDAGETVTVRAAFEFGSTAQTVVADEENSHATFTRLG